MVAKATDDIQTKARAGSNDFAQALDLVRGLNAAGKLNEAQLLAFADEGSFDKVVAALALMCDLPIGVVERAFVQNQTEQIVVLARALDISWATTVKLLLTACRRQRHLAAAARRDLRQFLPASADDRADGAASSIGCGKRPTVRRSETSARGSRRPDISLPQPLCQNARTMSPSCLPDA